jgi:hypothetical protein
MITVIASSQPHTGRQLVRSLFYLALSAIFPGIVQTIGVEEHGSALVFCVSSPGEVDDFVSACLLRPVSHPTRGCRNSDRLGACAWASGARFGSSPSRRWSLRDTMDLLQGFLPAQRIALNPQPEVIRRPASAGETPPLDFLQMSCLHPQTLVMAMATNAAITTEMPVVSRRKEERLGKAQMWGAQGAVPGAGTCRPSSVGTENSTSKPTRSP